MKVYKFYPDNRARFRFGERGDKINDLVSSDRLFSALYNCITLLYGNGEKAAKAAHNLMQLTLSSLNFGIQISNAVNGESQELYFLPRPLGPIRKQKEGKDLLNYKKVKKIAYLSLDAFSNLIMTWKPEEKYFDFDLSEFQIIGSKFACTRQEAELIGIRDDELQKVSLFTSHASPKVSISRQDDHSENFYFQEKIEVSFVETGDYRIRPFFYFICSGEVSRRVSAAVNLLAEEGLGGKRSSGMGILGKVDEVDWADRLPGHNSKYYVSLSSIYPNKNELDKLVYYDLADRAGYLHSLYGRSLRKKKVRLLKEGSIFSAKVAGRIIDVRPEGFDQHPVYLNGKAFLVPLGEV